MKTEETFNRQQLQGAVIAGMTMLLVLEKKLPLNEFSEVANLVMADGQLSIMTKRILEKLPESSEIMKVYQQVIDKTGKL